MSDPFLGELRTVAFQFVPRGWAACNGQILPIAQNQALFSLLGTTYGGNGINTFALPDLRGCMGVGQGSVPFGGSVFIGESGGQEAVTLNAQQVPPHSHTLNAIADLANSGVPDGALPAARPRGGIAMFAAGGSANTTMAPAAVANGGGGQAHNNMQPSLVLNTIIALQGIFPSHN